MLLSFALVESRRLALLCAHVKSVSLVLFFGLAIINDCTDRNFVRISSGPELGAYYHEFFLRDKSHLAAQMFCKNARTKLAMATHGENPALSLGAAAADPQEHHAAAAAPSSAAAASLPPPPTPNFNISPHYAAAVASLKQSLMPQGTPDERMLLQLREQQTLLETQMNIVQQADPATQLLLQQAILKEQAVQMQQLGVSLPGPATTAHPPPSSSSAAAHQTLLASTLALQQSQARLMQMREVLKMRFLQQNDQRKRSPHNNRASAA